MAEVKLPISQKTHNNIIEHILPFLRKVQDHAAKEDNKLVPKIQSILHVFENPTEQQ